MVGSLAVPDTAVATVRKMVAELESVAPAVLTTGLGCKPAFISTHRLESLEFSLYQIITQVWF